MMKFIIAPIVAGPLATSAHLLRGAERAPQPRALTSSSRIKKLFTKTMFNDFFPNIDNVNCSGKDFFSYDSFITATESFPDFANSGDDDVDALEIAAFLGQTSHETTGGWATAPGGAQSWGYCFKEENGCDNGTCTQYTAKGNPCKGSGYDCTAVAGQTYYGRGPIQLSWNYNYAAFSESILGDASKLVENPGRVSEEPVLSYQSALWFWMTAQSPKPSCHDVISGNWTPSDSDKAKGRTAGYGMVTNIINGGIECNKKTGSKVIDRVEFYKRYAKIMDVSVGEEGLLYCNDMESY